MKWLMKMCDHVECLSDSLCVTVKTLVNLGITFLLIAIGIRVLIG